MRTPMLLLAGLLTTSLPVLAPGTAAVAEAPRAPAYTASNETTVEDVVLTEHALGGSLSARPHVTRQSPPAAGRTTFGPVHERDSRQVWKATPSRRGDRVLALEGSRGTYALTVRTVDGRLLRQLTTSSPNDNLQPQLLSPSGTTAMWTTDTYNDARTVHVASVNSGATLSLPADYLPLGFVTDDVVLVRAGSALLTLSLSSGLRTPVAYARGNAGTGCATFDVALTRAVCFVPGRPDTEDRPALVVVPVSWNGLTLAFGAPRTLTTVSWSSRRAAAFSRDGATVYVTDRVGTGNGSELFAVPAVGGAVRPLGTPSGGVVTGVAVAARFGTLRDQTNAQLLGNAITVPRQGAHGGDTAFLRAAGATAALRLTGDRFQVLGERCPTCGAFDVYLGGVRQARVDSRASTRTPHAVLWSRGFQTARDQVLAVRAVGTPGRPTVVLDAFTERAALGPGASGLLAGQQLLPGQQLRSPDGAYRLVLQGDGHVVLYGRADRPRWATRTRTGAVLRMGVDGNLVLYGSAAPWQTRTGGNASSTLLVQRDGNVVLYRDRDGTPLWSSRSGRIT